MVKNDRKIENYALLPHVLIVDDDERIRDLLVRYLEDHGFVALAAESAVQVQTLLKGFACDVMILDVMMPGENGIEFAARLRASGQGVPILLLTALGETEDRIAGLEAGADDYLAKPFEPRELVLRLEVILKRTANPLKGSALMRIGGWVFDPEREALCTDDEVVSLTGAEVALLKALSAKAGEVLSREALAQACGLDAGERTIDVQVTRLRRKIEEDSKNPRYLQTVRGKGYRLRAEKV